MRDEFRETAEGVVRRGDHPRSHGLADQAECVGVWFVDVLGGVTIECDGCGHRRLITDKTPLSEFAGNDVARCASCNAYQTHLLGSIDFDGQTRLV